MHLSSVSEWVPRFKFGPRDAFVAAGAAAAALLLPGWMNDGADGPLPAAAAAASGTAGTTDSIRLVTSTPDPFDHAKRNAAVAEFPPQF